MHQTSLLLIHRELYSWNKPYIFFHLYFSPNFCFQLWKENNSKFSNCFITILVSIMESSSSEIISERIHQILQTIHQENKLVSIPSIMNDQSSFPLINHLSVPHRAFSYIPLQTSCWLHQNYYVLVLLTLSFAPPRIFYLCLLKMKVLIVMSNILLHE